MHHPPEVSLHAQFSERAHSGRYQCRGWVPIGCDERKSVPLRCRLLARGCRKSTQVPRCHLWWPLRGEMRLERPTQRRNMCGVRRGPQLHPSTRTVSAARCSHRHGPRSYLGDVRPPRDGRAADLRTAGRRGWRGRSQRAARPAAAQMPQRRWHGGRWYEQRRTRPTSSGARRRRIAYRAHVTHTGHFENVVRGWVRRLSG